MLTSELTSTNVGKRITNSYNNNCKIRTQVARGHVGQGAHSTRGLEDHHLALVAHACMYRE